MTTLRKSSIGRATAVVLLFVGLIGALGAQAARTEAAPDGKTDINILAIGDSVTFGFWAFEPQGTGAYLDCKAVDGYTRACKGDPVPFDKVDSKGQTDYASYRLPLYQLFHIGSNVANLNVTFVGSPETEKEYKLDGNPPGYPVISANYPRPTALDELAFVGAAGKTSSQIAGTNGEAWEILDAMPQLAAVPDVALIHLGTNDVKTGKTEAQSKKAFETILKTLRNESIGGNKAIKIYIAQIIPVAYPGEDYCNKGGYTFGAVGFCDAFHYAVGTDNKVKEFNTRLRGWCGTLNDVDGTKLVKECTKLTEGESTVYLVDHYTHFEEGSGPDLLWLIPSDGLHPNRTGECEMAMTWYQAMGSTEYTNLNIPPGDFCKKYGERYDTPVEEDLCEPVEGNLVGNFCFDQRRTKWRFRLPAQGTFVASDANPFAGQYAAEVTINQSSGNIQFHQSGLDLQPDTTYELSFAAYSSDGSDMSLWVHQHRRPYTTYGMAGQQVPLETAWRTYQYTFTTPHLVVKHSARLRFWFKPYAQDGTVYHIDRVVLRPLP